MRFLGLAALGALLGLTSCFHLNAGAELTWDPSPDAIVIEASTCCGFTTYLTVLNNLPGGKVWGDGRYIWFFHDDEDGRQVFEGRLDEAQLRQFLTDARSEGFFGWDDLYVDEQVADAPTQCLEINLTDRFKEVCEIFRGAPAAFHTLYDRLASGLGVAGSVYEPERGYLIAHPVTFDPPPTEDQIDLDWPADEAGISLSEGVDGLWVEGPALTLAWAVVNAGPFGNIVRDGGEFYQVSLQVPGLSLEEPPGA